jgi:hypothetical protein
MGAQEHRLRVQPDGSNRAGSVFEARGLDSRRREDLYLCGGCSIIFAAASIPAIRSGSAGSCTNCGAVNQL